MKTATETKVIYISDDGKRKSDSKCDIEKYELHLKEEELKSKSFVKNIGYSTTVYKFTEKELEDFKDLVEFLHVNTNEVKGYFVYIQNADFDGIGYDYTLYSLDQYRNMIQNKIEGYQKLLEDAQSIQQ